MKRLSFLLLFLILLLALPAIRPVAAQSEPPTPEEVLAEVNALRVAAGLDEYTDNRQLMDAAENQADYMALIEGYTHIGPGGSNVVDRALETGYGGTGQITCSESVAMASIATSADYVVNTIWNTYADKLVIYNEDYQDAGVGVVEKDGSVYYVLNACLVEGEAAPVPTTMTGTPRAPTSTVLAETPIPTRAAEADGSITHEVSAGESLWTISMAYGVDVNTLIGINDLDAKGPVIYPGQKIIIQPAFTQTVSPTPSETPRQPTRTARPTATLRPTREAGAVTEVVVLPTATLKSVSLPGNITARQQVGLGVLAVSGIGILAMVVIGLLKRRNQ